MRRMTLLALPAALLVAVLAFVAGGLTGGLGAALAAVDEPRGDTIVEVTGDRANGFTIRHYDGTELFTPTDSEARAECSEYDRRVQRVRCRVHVRTWYRDLGALERALDWAHTG